MCVYGHRMKSLPTDLRPRIYLSYAPYALLFFFFYLVATGNWKEQQQQQQQQKKHTTYHLAKFKNASRSSKQTNKKKNVLWVTWKDVMLLTGKENKDRPSRVIPYSKVNL